MPLTGAPSGAPGQIADAGSRPAASVVVPFAGSPEAARACVTALARLRLRPDDEVVLADNSRDGVLQRVDLPAGFRVVRAVGEGSPPRARNAGALEARNPWLVFVDSDCRPEPGLLDGLLAPPPDDRCGLVAGGVADAPEQRSLAATHARTRRVLNQEHALEHDFLPYALTANLAVRRAVWDELGGFLEGVLNGEDVDFCWRAQRAGWTIARRLDAVVEHVHRDDVRGLLRQHAIQRASAIWVHRRWPEAPLPPAPLLAPVARALAAAPLFALTGQIRRARLKALDGAVALAVAAGAWRANRAHPWPAPAPRPGRRPIIVLCDAFPVVSETFVIEEARALQALGHPVRIVAHRRPDRPRPGITDLRVSYVEDETRLERLRALASVVVRHPARCVRDRLARRRWWREEDIPGLRAVAVTSHALEAEPGAVVHAHFAKGAALTALRASRLAGRPWSLTAHAFDIYKDPSNLRDKVRAASIVTSGCDYTVRDLREIAGPSRAGRVHRIVMGVDPEAFVRRTPHPSEPLVVGVGRLVEKKGFVDLVRAMARPAVAELGGRLVLAGDGPLLEDLQREAAALGVEDRVSFAGRCLPTEIRELLERAAVLAMPCIVAADGDRDSMPVVVKEALAMEVPVVVTDEVGLPELVRPEFGRLVPPSAPDELGDALAELLARTPEERAAMGAAGRAFIVREANVMTESARLAQLLQDMGPGGPGAGQAARTAAAARAPSAPTT